MTAAISCRRPIRCAGATAIASALLHDRQASAGSRARVNADDIEQLVVEVLARELSRPELSAGSPSTGWSPETRTVVRDTVEQVVVQGDQLHISRKPAAPSATAAPDEDDTAPQVHVVPLSAPRPRARKEIIVPGGHNSSPRRLNHALILAIARAKSWMRDLRNGTYADTIEIARQFQLNDAHVRRVLRFGYLAPDIVEAIIEGRQPRCLECYIETRISFCGVGHAEACAEGNPLPLTEPASSGETGQHRHVSRCE